MKDEVAQIRNRAAERRKVYRANIHRLPHVQEAEADLTRVIDLIAASEAKGPMTVKEADRLLLQLELKERRVQELRGGKLEKLEKSYGSHLDWCSQLQDKQEKEIDALRSVVRELRSVLMTVAKYTEHDKIQNPDTLIVDVHSPECEFCLIQEVLARTTARS